MAPLIVYEYRADTGAFIKSAEATLVPGRENLLDEDIRKWQIPANATTIAPVTVTVDEVAVFTPGPNTWAPKADLTDRTVYDIASGFEVTFGIDRPNLPPGSDLPAGLSLTDVGFDPGFLSNSKDGKQRSLLVEHTRQRQLPISVTVSPGTFDFAATPLDIEALNFIVTEIAAGISVPSPRLWYVVGAADQSLTNQDFLDVWAALTNRVDSLRATLITKQGEIDALPDPQSVVDYDVSAGW